MSCIHFKVKKEEKNLWFFCGRQYVNRLVRVPANDKDASQPVASHSLIGDFVVRSKHDISSFYRDTPGIWTVGVAEQACSGRPDQPETRETGFLSVGPMLFYILHLIHTCRNINIYMTICIFIIFMQPPPNSLFESFFSPFFFSNFFLFFTVLSAPQSNMLHLPIKLATLKNILYIYFDSYVTYRYLSVK